MTFDELMASLSDDQTAALKSYVDSRVTAGVKTYRENHRSEGATEIENAYSDRLAALENRYTELESERTSDNLISTFCITNPDLSEKQRALAQGCRSADPDDTKRRLELLHDSIVEDRQLTKNEVVKSFGRSVDAPMGRRDPFGGAPEEWTLEKMGRYVESGGDPSKLKRSQPYTTGETSQQGWHRPAWGGSTEVKKPL